MAAETPLVSVIVPVYNVRGYLRKCVRSLQNQTERDIEIILVDDGSTDGSGKLCDRLAARDSRIVVCHQKNSGVSAARNKGMDLARGANTSCSATATIPCAPGTARPAWRPWLSRGWR